MRNEKKAQEEIPLSAPAHCSHTEIPYAKIMSALPDWETTESEKEPGGEKRQARVDQSVEVWVRTKKREEDGCHTKRKTKPTPLGTHAETA